ncbi:MAG: sensor histidine kinase [Ardenticatenaceae bacterium]
MYKREFSFDTQQLMRIALILWMAYFFVLALLDWLFVSRQSEVILYYAIQGFNGFIILLLTRLPWKPLWLERAILPVTLALMTILPTLTVHIMIWLAPNKALLSPEGMTLRLTPILLMGLLLTAWTYKLKHVIVFCLGTAVLNLVGIWIPGPKSLQALSRPRPYSGMLVTVIQTLSLLIVGYFTSALNSRLRAQQRALSEANAQLRDQASTREELTISQERNRMARELHDTLAHTLSGLSVQLQAVKAYWQVDPLASQEMLDGALAATRSGLQETRRALKALRATPLENLGLLLAIRELAESAAERGKLELELSFTDPLPFLTAEISQCIYRVAQEAITNVLYHANAKRLSVEIRGNNDEVQLKIEDDGVGFDVNRQYTGHWGVQGMRERAQQVGGRLEIKSQPHHGTTIQLVLDHRFGHKS